MGMYGFPSSQGAEPASKVGPTGLGVLFGGGGYRCCGRVPRHVRGGRGRWKRRGQAIGTLVGLRGGGGGSRPSEGTDQGTLATCRASGGHPTSQI